MKANMNMRSEILILIVVVLFGPFLGIVCAFFLPAFLPGFKAAWTLTAGILIATAIGGYIGYHVPSADTVPVKMTLSFCYAVVVAILVSFLSLLIVVNVRGE